MAKKGLIMLVVIVCLLAGCRSRQDTTGAEAQKKTAGADMKAPQHQKTVDVSSNRFRYQGEIIDSHTLITPLDQSIDKALGVFEQLGIVKFCNKNGGFLGHPRFAATVNIKKRLGDRFEFFANLAWMGVNSPDWGMREAERLKREVKMGAKGLKIFKALGLTVRDAEGKLLHVNDRRLDPVFKAAAGLNAIVAMHTGDPKAFFEPVTPANERYDELSAAPDWSFYGKDYPSRQQLLTERNEVLARHPDTTFLLIHLGNNPEDLDYAAEVLEKYPNVYMDTSARVPEIGRHPPEKVREFFIRFQDRILFGTDFGVSPHGMHLGSLSKKPPTFQDAVNFYKAHFRYFETGEKQIEHPTPIQGNWKIDSADLPDEVLKKFYYDNARKLIFERKMNI